MKTDEIWKDVVGYEGLYMISSFGNVKSLKRLGTGERILSTREQKGYVIVTITKKRKVTTKLVHRLVAEAFIPNDDETKNIVHHINGIKNDNRIDNLMWTTQLENMQLFYKNVEQAKERAKKLSGENNGNSKLTDEKVKIIIKLCANGKLSIEEISEIMDISSTNIYDIIQGNIWKHV